MPQPMRRTRGLATLLAAALAALAGLAVTASGNSLPVRTGTGGTVNLSTTLMPDGSSAVTHVLTDGAGVPYSPAHPLLTAPAIYPLAFTDRSGRIATPGAVALDLAADAGRKGGSIRAAAANSGSITVTLKDGAGNTHDEVLQPGDSYSLTVNGSVLQVEILLSGSAAGDSFSAVTYQ